VLCVYGLVESKGDVEVGETDVAELADLVRS
jgi:hypothetical protein